MKLRFLGTGTSFGVPVIGCPCAVCHSPDPRNRRSRHAIILEQGGRRLLVDTPPELRLQLIAGGIGMVDAVWFTHTHADHTAGLDDLRAFSLRKPQPLPVYAAPEHAEELARRFNYVFDPAVHPHEGTSKPDLELRTFESFVPIEIAGFEVTPLPVEHGSIEAYGFRIGDLGYVTDAKRLHPRTHELLIGSGTLVLNALWRGNPHPTHLNVEEAVALAERLRVGRCFLTHLTHRLEHQELLATLPAGVAPAYDGLELEL